MKIVVLLLSFLVIPQAYPKYILGLGDLSCGQDGQRRCSFFNKEFWLNGSGGCDRGLKTKKGICRPKRRNTIKNSTHKWISQAMKFQRELQADLPINQMGILWGHNIYNNRADGYIFPNHKYSVTDVLDLGVRALEFDPHSIGKRIRLCHGKITPIGNLKVHLICPPTDRLFFNIIEELNLWMRKEENKNEVVIVKIQDETEGRRELLELPFKQHLDDLILRPNDLNLPNRYPSINEIRAIGKRIMITGGPFNSGFSGGARFNANTFDGKLCKRNGANIDPTFNKGISNNWFGMASDAVKYFRVFEGPKVTGMISPELVKEAIECNVSRIEVDMVEVEHARNFVWTWAEGEPLKWNKGKRCVSIDKNGRWHAEDCDRKLPFACQSNTNSGIWNVTYRSGTFDQGQDFCNRQFIGFKFSYPMNGWENARLYRNHRQTAWINFSNSDT